MGAGDLDNAAIAERLEAFASLLDLADSGFYTSRAYRRAAETVRETPVPVDELVRAGRVRELRGIGPGDRGAARGAGRDRARSRSSTSSSASCGRS